MTWEKFIRHIINIADKYYLIAGFAFLIFYILLKKNILYKKIQTISPKSKDYLREISFSTLSMLIFAITPLVILNSNFLRPHTLYYENISQYGIFYFFAAFVIMLLIHDTYFYWIHRFMHVSFFFKTFHLVHHKSTNPSPWASYSFHPLEAVIESLIFAVFLFTIPIHRTHLIVFFTFSLAYNVYGHLGYELYPKGFNKHWLGKWINTSVSHNQHHQYFKGNYGLYFTFWDRWMGTMRQDYDSAFDKLKAREKLNDVHLQISTPDR
jgi:sterol desaturase/sphingolipid hydroxylase (fatty acid hydroxylase superfamily)